MNFFDPTTIITNHIMKFPELISPEKDLFVNKNYLKNVVLKI